MRILEMMLVATELLGLSCIVAFDSGWHEFTVDAQFLSSAAVDLLAFSALVLLLHAVIEGLRWQLVPLYLALAFLGGALFFSITGHSSMAGAFSVLGVLCIVASCLLSWALPMFRFAPLTGRYKTATSIHHMVDKSREDISPSRYRELMIQLWYPSADARQPFAPYRRKQETTRISSYQGVLKTRSLLEAAPAQSEKPFPVLLFNPAWNGRRTQNTFLIEELASHGFVIAAIDHTYNSEPIAFPDGRVVLASHERAMEDFSDSTPEKIQRVGNDEVARQALDDRFVLDQLAMWNDEKGTKWYQRLDTDHAGAFGHSLGGATSVEVWATDPRVVAAMNMDGWTFGDQAITGRRSDFAAQVEITGQLLFLYEGNYIPFPDEAAAQASGKSRVELEVDRWDAGNVRELLQHYGGYWLQLQGADHANFTDRPITSPMRRFAGGGSIDARKAHRIVRDYAVAFFSQALLGIPSALLDGNRGYAEVMTRTAREPVTPETTL